MNITLLEEEALPASQGLTRVRLEIRLPRPAWGVLNVTGPVVAWSIAEEPPQVRLLVKGTHCSDSSLQPLRLSCISRHKPCICLFGG